MALNLPVDLQVCQVGARARGQFPAAQSESVRVSIIHTQDPDRCSQNTTLGIMNSLTGVNICLFDFSYIRFSFFLFIHIQ